jgi:ribose/xylose/arabinose/galactoside ABC-type transport system permease subunit
MDRKINWKREFSQNSIWVVLVVEVIFMIFASPVFMTKRNIVSILQTESIVGILTMGVMFAILSKGIDLSPGAMVGLTSVVSASLAQNIFYTKKLFPGIPDLPVIVPILSAILVGVFFGIMNGALIGYTKIPAFIATLGIQLVVKALAQLYTNAYPVPNLKNEFKVLGQGNLLEIPNVVWIFFVFVAIAGFF